ncbi:zinc knuckle CX2CX4HX4C containing protein [Tanacetum coccineum]
MKENTPISNHDPNVFPPLKKGDSILKPKKTTRTMNPESGDTMKHRTMLGRSSHVSFKERITRSSLKKGDLVMDMDEEGCDEGTLESGVSGMVDETGLNVNSGIINDILMGNSGLGSNGSDAMAEIPVPFDENPILNPSGNSNNSSNSGKVNLKEVKVPGMFKIVGDGSMLKKGVGSVSNFGVGDQSSAAAMNDEGREVAVMDPVLEEGIDKWSMTVLEEVIVNQGLYYFHFKSHEGMQSVIENGPWMVENKPLFVRKWEARLCMSKLDTSKLPLWVKIYDIPLEAWNVEGIIRIAIRIGVPIIMDKITTSICEKPYGRASYARLLVEVDAAKGLVDSVEIWYKNLGKSMMLNVEYVWQPSLCDHCKTFGHFSKFCSKAQASVDKENKGEVKVKNNLSAGNVNNDQDGWQNVNYRRENLSKYVPVKNKEKVVNVDECLVTDEVIKSKSSSGADKLNKDDAVKDDLGKRGCNVKSIGVNGQESTGMDDISMSNRFDVLIEENEEEGLDTWEDVRIQVLSACNSGVPIVDEENLCSRIVQLKSHRHENARRSALQLVKETDETTGIKSNKSLFDKYFNQCCKEIDIKVKELQWDKRRFEVDIFMMSKKALSDDVKQAWTDDMEEYFLDRCEEVKNDEKNGHYADDGDAHSMEEVQEDNSRSARFMVQNEVSNGIDDSIAYMQGGLAEHPSSFQ